MAKMSEIANQTGCSVAMVSRTLRGLSSGGTPKQRHILRIARDLGYKVGADGNTSHLSKTRQIAFLSCAVSPETLSNPVAFSPLFDGINKIIETRGYSLVVSNISRGHVPPCLLQKSVDGVLFHGFIGKEFYDNYLGTIPSLGLQYQDPQLPCSWVIVDNFSAMYQMVEYLVSLGHRKIGFVANEIDRMHTAQRYDGFVKAMKYFDLPVRDEYIVVWERPMKDGIAPFELVLPDFLPNIGHLFRNPQNCPTAIVCPGDWQAMAVMEAARKMGLKIPDDLSVTGVGHHSPSQSGDLTSVDDRVTDVAAIAARHLLEMIEGRTEEQLTICVRPKLIISHSTCPVKPVHA